MAGVTLAFAAPRRQALLARRAGAAAAAPTTPVGAVPIPALVPGRTRVRGGRGVLAAAIPGDSVVESVTVGGFANFFGIYGNLLIARVLLSWFPAAQVWWGRRGVGGGCACSQRRWRASAWRRWRSVLGGRGGVDAA